MPRHTDTLIRAIALGLSLTTLSSPAKAQWLSPTSVPEVREDTDVVHWLADRLYAPPSPSVAMPEQEIPPGKATVNEDVVATGDPMAANSASQTADGSGYAALNPDPFAPVWLGAPEWLGATLWNGQCRHTRIYRSEFLGRLWFDAEILGWATKRQNFPALVTTSPLGTAAANAGVLGLGTTSILFGDERLHDELRLGGRLTAGWWWDVNQLNGVELHYFGVDGLDVDYRAAGTGADIIARPFTDSTTGLPASALVAYPGLVDGAIRVRADMEFSGAGAYWRQILWGGHRSRLDFVVGYRYLRLYDQLTTRETLDSLNAASGFPAGLLVDRFDRFRTENEFHGGELGLVGRWQRHRWSLELTGNMAVGTSHRGLLIDGRTTTTDAANPPNVTVYPGGLLAQPSALGSYTDSETSYMAEIGASFQYQLTCQCRIYAGYTFIYWDDVARNADQINVSIDPGQIPPAGGPGAPPVFTFNEADFWAQGLTAGLTYQF